MTIIVINSANDFMGLYLAEAMMRAGYVVPIFMCDNSFNCWSLLGRRGVCAPPVPAISFDSGL